MHLKKIKIEKYKIYQSNFSLVGGSSNVSIIKLLINLNRCKTFLLRDLFLWQNLRNNSSLTDDKLPEQSFDLFILWDSEDEVSVSDPDLATWKAHVSGKWDQLMCEVLEDGSEGNTRAFGDPVTESALSHQSCHSWHWEN